MPKMWVGGTGEDGGRGYISESYYILSNGAGYISKIKRIVIIWTIRIARF
jgi:hypothetical protein